MYIKFLLGTFFIDLDILLNMKESFEEIFNLNPRYSTTIAFILGLILIDSLTAYEQNVVGNWLILVGQTVLTNASCQNLIEGRSHGGIVNINSKEVKCLYNPIMYDINTIKEIIDKVYPDNEMDISVLKKAIKNLQDQIDKLK